MAPQLQQQQQYYSSQTNGNGDITTTTHDNNHHHQRHHHQQQQHNGHNNGHNNNNHHKNGHHHQHQHRSPTTATSAHDIMNDLSEDNHHQQSATEIMYTVDHLATFSVGETYGLLCPTDGLRRLRQMERTSGIWTQRMLLRIEARAVVMIDFDSNETVERFPMQLVQEPVAAFLSDDAAELYNNILVFTVVADDSAVLSASASPPSPSPTSSVPTEMHLFHCLRASADRVADELRYAMRRAREKHPQNNKYVGASALPTPMSASPQQSEQQQQNGKFIPPAPPMPPPSTAHNNNKSHQKSTLTKISNSNNNGNGTLVSNGHGVRQPKSSLGVSVKQTVQELNNVIEARRFVKKRGASPNALMTTAGGVGNATNGHHHHHHHNHQQQRFVSPTSRLHHQHQKSTNGHHHNNNGAAAAAAAEESDFSSRSELNLNNNNNNWINRGFAAHRRNYPQPPPPPATKQRNKTSAGGSSVLSSSSHPAALEDDYEREVHVLNRCFDDIESFIARLQIAYASRDELERRRRFGAAAAAKSKLAAAGGSKNNKKIVAAAATAVPIVNEQLLAQRAQLPPERDFVDILQKFKLSFNLLAKLKGQIHDPNSPELVHFLFTPLAMIVDAVQHASLLLPPHEWPAPPDLAQRVLSPLLKRETIQLLQNCLTSKEFDLWKSLGEAWSIPFESWRGPVVPPYRPVFYSGWEPYGSANDDWQQKQQQPQQNQQPLEHIALPPVGVDPYQWLETHPLPEEEEEEEEEDEEERANRLALADVEKRQRHWVDELEACGARMVHVVYPRAGANEKELSAQRGEVLQVLDATRNWWKLKNWRGDVGYAPHTILAPYPPQAAAGANAQ